MTKDKNTFQLFFPIDASLTIGNKQIETNFPISTRDTTIKSYTSFIEKK